MKALHESHFAVTRLGAIMRPDAMRDEEAGGVLNPGTARGPDGQLYLFPHVVGKNNQSRIGIARVIFDRDGDPIGVDRLGYALEPEAPYELSPHDGTGGVEDARVTFVESLGLYVMTYVACGPSGPRAALAISENCLQWERLGLVDFEPGRYAKHAAVVPELLQTRSGEMIAMFHQSLYGSPGMWLSAADYGAVKRDIRNLRIMRHQMLVSDATAAWEARRARLGTPPVRTPLGYMIVSHGVTGDAGVMIFRREADRALRHGFTAPILISEIDPTGIDRRADDVYDIYYGMSDKSIGAARLWLPDSVDYEEVTS